MTKTLALIAAAAAAAATLAGPSFASPVSYDQTGVMVDGRCPVALALVGPSGQQISGNVTALRNGACRFDQMHSVTLAELRPVLVGLPRQPILVNAFPNTPYVNLMRVLNSIQDAGTYTVIIGANPPPT